MLYTGRGLLQFQEPLTKLQKRMLQLIQVAQCFPALEQHLFLKAMYIPYIYNRLCNNGKDGETE